VRHAPRLQLCAVLLLLACSAQAAGVFQEANGLVVVEVESAPVAGSWSSQSGLAGFTGTSYYEWKTGNTATTVDAAGQGILSYRFKINQTGRYRFQLRSAAPHSTEHNDVWLRVPSGAVKIKGTTVTSLGAAWFKVYQNAGANAWSWNAWTTDHDAHSIHADFNTPGEYTLELSGRSTQFKIDRFVLYHSSVSSTTALNTANAQSSTAAANTGNVTGEQRKWHKVTVTFDGPTTSETATPNPFTDYRLNVTFTHPATGKTYVVPGYYAADGNAAESSATSGNKWRVHFAPDEVGTWNYSASFRTGANIAVDLNSTAGTAVSFDGASGTLNILASDKSGKDLRAKGRLKYVTNERYLQFAETKEFFVKAGADSPENMFGYVDFDGTSKQDGTALKTWSAHVADSTATDPVWQGTKGRGLLGAINYLASEGCNVFSFLTYNAGGDGKDVWPFIAATDRLRYDCSKLDQWQRVMDHAQTRGMYLHFKTQETENDNGTWGLDGGEVLNERKLYYRELVARFGYHLALNWNLGEENTQTTAQRVAMAEYFKDVDPYDHHIVIHTYPAEKSLVYTPLLGNASQLTGVSLQSDWAAVHRDTLTWINNSANAGKAWVVANDEQGSADVGIPDDAYTLTPTQKQVRGAVLWGNLLAGGAGIESYFGYQRPHSDLTCQDFRSRDRWWDDCRHALHFFNTYLRFAEMSSANALVGNSTNDNSKYCFAKPNDTYAIYLANGGTTTLNLTSASGTFEVKWFDPRNGGTLQNGSVLSVTGGASVSLGSAPNNPTLDWVILVRRTGTPPQTYALTVDSGSGDGNYTQGAVVTITADAAPAGQVFSQWTGATQYLANVSSATTTVTMPAAAISVTATYTTSTSQAVTSLTLINADTDQPVAGHNPLMNGATINFATIGTRNLNIRANTNPATVGSVRFGLDTNPSHIVENVAPYALAGDTSGNYNAWTPTLGSHTVTATPFSGSAASGTAGTALTINFTVIDQAGDTIAPTAPSNLLANAKTHSSVSLSWTAATDNVGVTGYEIWRNSVRIATTTGTSYVNSGLAASTTYSYFVKAYDAAGNVSVASNTVTVTTDAAPQAVSSLTLINADTNQPIAGFDPISNGAMIDLSTLPTRNLNIRANTSPAVVGSVRFALDTNSNFRTESVAPYALAGDTNGDYYAWTPTVGSHTLRATPYSAANATGTVGTALTINFSVTSGAALLAAAAGVDSDADGLQDDYELAHGLDPQNSDTDGNGILDGSEVVSGGSVTHAQNQQLWLASLSGTPGAGPQAQAFRLTRFQAVVSVSAAKGDSCALSAILPGDAAVSGLLVLRLGDAQFAFELDGKGDARGENGTLSLKKRSSKKGASVTLKAKLHSKSLVAAWNMNETSRELTLPVTVTIGGVSYAANLDASVAQKNDVARIKK